MSWFTEILTAVSVKQPDPQCLEKAGRFAWLYLILFFGAQIVVSIMMLYKIQAVLAVLPTSLPTLP